MRRIIVIALCFSVTGSALAAEKVAAVPKFVTFTVTPEEANIIADAVYGVWPSAKAAMPLIQKLRDQANSTAPAPEALAEYWHQWCLGEHTCE